MKTFVESTFVAKIENVTIPDSVFTTPTGITGCGRITGYEVIEKATGYRIAWFGVQNPHASFRCASRLLALERAARFVRNIPLDQGDATKRPIT